MRVAVTGLGVVSAFGVGAAALRLALQEGRGGLSPVRHFDTSPYPSRLAGSVPGFDGGPQRKNAAFEFAVRAGTEALAQARPRGSVALVLGTSIGVTDGTHHALAERLAGALGLTGPVIAITTACCSSNNALGLGAELLEAGDVDAVLAGGTDQITEEMFAGFSMLGALSAGPCAPFSLPTGTTLGEGAGFVVLERAGEAAARGARTLSWVLGEALSCDAMHEVAPDATGRGVARCVGSALHQAQVAPAAVDYVNAHGTGTAHNDAAEWKGLTTALGRDSVLVSSTKGTLGHAQGAAGVLEIIASLLCLEDGRVPSTQNFAGPRNRCPGDPVGQATPRAATVQRWVATNSAFWGANASLVFSTQEVPTAPAARVRPRIVVAGFGSAAGTAELQRTLPRVDLSALDLPSRLVTCAVAEALGGLGPVVKGELREGLGLFLGAVAPSRDARTRFDASIEERGMAKLSAEAFTRMVTSAIGGACARLLGLRGPFTTLTSGFGSGLVALACAARYLELHDDVRGVVVASVDEREEPGATGRACAVLLAREGALPVTGPLLEVCLAGAGHLAQALAALGAPPPASTDDASVSGSLERLGGVLQALRSSGGSRVVGQSLGATSCAVRLTCSPENP